MNIQIIGSDKLKSKLTKQLNGTFINIVDKADIELVERGYSIDEDKVNIIFNPLDYDEVISLLCGGDSDVNLEDHTLTGLLNDRYTMITIEDINFIEAQSSMVYCHTEEAKYTIKKTLSYYENELKSQGIIRINKSQLVNMRKVKEIVPWFNSRLVFILDTGIELEVSKVYSKSIRKLLSI